MRLCDLRGLCGEFLMLTPAREVAFKILVRVEREASYASELLNSSLADRLSPPDRALAQEIVMGCLRWQLQLDWLAAHFSGKLPAAWDPEVRCAIRMGIYQIRFLERIPASAAVDQSVEAVKRAGKRSAAGLVNAVLRKVNHQPIEELLPPGLPAAERMAVLLAHPEWLLARWAARYGDDRAAAIARINNLPAPVYVRVAPGVAAELGKPCAFVRDCRELTGEPSRPGGRPGGALVFQDEASQIVPYLLEPQSARRILDLCAAPGVKTGAIRELAPDAVIVAGDVRPARLRLLRQLAAPGRGAPPACVALDGTRPLPFATRFDRILVDAPCSGTGTIRRNPEIKCRLLPKDLSLLAARQRWLLSNALDALAPGGRAVYSTCSIELEENEAVIEEVLKDRNDCRLRPVEQLAGEFLTQAGRELLRGQFFRTLPDQGLDGFFAAVIERVQGTG